MRRRNLAVLVSLSLMGTMSMTGYAASEKETTTEAASTEAGSTEAESKSADQEAADKVADLIDAIYVQERTDKTDEQCKEAKEAWDALTDAQKELVEGENADPDYFGRDTGDASKDDPRNGDEIGENEILVVSFGTSFNDSRAADIKIFCGKVPGMFTISIILISCMMISRRRNYSIFSIICWMRETCCFCREMS